MKQGWSYYSLGDVCDIYQPTTIATEKLIEDGQYPVFGANGIIGRYDYYNHEEPEVLLTCRGATCGKINVSLPFCWINGNAMVIHKKDGIDLTFDFLRYLMMSIDYEKVITGAAQPQITRQKLSPTIVGFPSVEIQSHIVEELNQINALIAIKEKQLQELEELEQTIFHEMFGDPIDNEKGWEVAPLQKNVKEMFLGPFGSSLKVDSYVSQEESYCMVYEQKHAIKGTIDLDNHYIDKEKFDSLERFCVKPGDFIMSCRGTIGKLYRLPVDAPIGIIHPSLMKIRLKVESYNPTFFQFMLVKIVANERTNGNCVQMAITAKTLGEKKLIVPSMEKQESFAKRVKLIREQMNAVNTTKKDLEELLASRMQYWFD